jgi:hypothetical protein
MRARLQHLNSGREVVVRRCIRRDLVDHIAARRQRLPERLAVFGPSTIATPLAKLFMAGLSRRVGDGRHL